MNDFIDSYLIGGKTLSNRNLLRLKLFCLRELKNAIDNDYASYFDPLGGIGLSAKIFEKDKSLTYVNDRSNDCYASLLKSFKPENCSNIDLEKKKFTQKFDLIFADYDAFTIKKLDTHKSLDNMFSNANKYVIVNDCSIYQIRRFGKSGLRNASNFFGISITTVEEYFAQIAGFYLNLYPEWYLQIVVTWDNSAFLLFGREKKELQIFQKKRGDAEFFDIDTILSGLLGNGEYEDIF